MTTNVEPPRTGAVGGAAGTAGTAPGTTTTPAGISKKEPIGKHGHPLARFLREFPLPRKSWRHWRLERAAFHTTRRAESCEFIHQSLGCLLSSRDDDGVDVATAAWEYFDVGVARSLGV